MIELNLDQCELKAEGTTYLTRAISTMTTLRVLNLNFNVIDSQGAQYLGKSKLSLLVEVLVYIR